MKGNQVKNSIYWFRKGLRLHDNPSLMQSLKNSTQIYPIFILDPFYVKSGNVGPNRWRFLFEALHDLDSNLRKLESRLFLLQGKPEEVLPDKIKEWKISTLAFQIDTQPYSKLRDEKIKEQCAKMNIKIISSWSHTLYDLQDLYSLNGKETIKSYGGFLKLLKKKGLPERPIPSPTLDSFKDKKPKIAEELYLIPKLNDIGIDQQKDCGKRLYPGGETEALERMNRYLKSNKWICSFQKPKTSPNSINPSTTVLSPYLKFGNISPRLFYHKIMQIYKQNGGHTLPPVSLQGQLLWRQFFYFNGAFTPNFDKIEGNPICKQIKWDQNDVYFNAWKQAKTGYPFIDAVMTQLREEGWIHHLGRHAVACFLTRGDLYISWERGKEVFQNLLLDADWSLNAANWMWLSASGFFYQYFRVYSPIAFGKKTDPKGEYIRKYLPKLSKFPDKFIYQPWNAPLIVQKQAKCVIGVDYPFPIVDHSVVSKKNMQKMSKYYSGGDKIEDQ